MSTVHRPVPTVKVKPVAVQGSIAEKDEKFYPGFHLTWNEKSGKGFATLVFKKDPRSDEERALITAEASLMDSFTGGVWMPGASRFEGHMRRMP